MINCVTCAFYIKEDVVADPSLPHKLQDSKFCCLNSTNLKGISFRIVDHSRLRREITTDTGVG